MIIIKSIYLRQRLYILLSSIVVLFILGFIWPLFYSLGKLSILVVVGLVFVDSILLYSKRDGVLAERIMANKLSNGDKNNISIYIQNNYSFQTQIEILDEIPHQFQIRDFLIKLSLNANQQGSRSYTVRPVKRGEYKFGGLHVFVVTVLGLVSRRYTFSSEKNVPVYPSFVQMRKYALLAISNRLTMYGVKKIRKIGHNQEFDQIKLYTFGDDYRTVNWKATARKGELMVNQYQDERSQQVYSVIDKGRVMKMPFEGMSLLDYAINASLVISNIAISKDDKAGLMTFTNRVQATLPASKNHSQMQKIADMLYNQKTNFEESDFESLYAHIKRAISQRSLILLYTNFETVSSLQNQLPYLQKIATTHLLIVVFFENTELKSLIEKKPTNTEEIYLQTIAEKFAFEKRLIVKELQKVGIQAILTSPQHLTVNTINKYLELKARGLI